VLQRQPDIGADAGERDTEDGEVDGEGEARGQQQRQGDALAAAEAR